MGSTAKNLATSADIEALPDGIKGEIIDGVLHTQARPRPAHARVGTNLSFDLFGPFDRGREGPGGWWILVEPGISLQGSNEFAPDLAGWRRDRLPEIPEHDPITIVPDWICEILSPSTRSYDQRIKRPFYARIGVAYLWYVDIDARTLTVSKLIDGRWTELGVYGEDDKFRAEPFDAVEIAMGEWWARTTAS